MKGLSDDDHKEGSTHDRRDIRAGGPHLRGHALPGCLPRPEEPGRRGGRGPDRPAQALPAGSAIFLKAIKEVTRSFFPFVIYFRFDKGEKG